jgi:hypothetical protein
VTTIRSVAAKVVWVGRTATIVFGLAFVLALVVGIGTAALAAVPGDPFRLGKTNTIDQMSTLVGSASGTLLRINNDGSGPALDLRVEPGEAPMNVNSTTQVNGLNADQVDGQSANDFVSKDKTYTVSETEAGSGGGADETVFADCDSGDRVLGGGGGARKPLRVRRDQHHQQRPHQAGGLEGRGSMLTVDNNSSASGSRALDLRVEAGSREVRPMKR